MHANVVPMDSDRVLRDQTVVVSGGRIAAIGPSETTRSPQGAKVIDARGGYLTPGLADMHVHVYTPEELTLYVVNGVTTVFNLNGRPQYLEWRRRISDGKLLGPAIYSTGPTFDRPRSPEAAVEDVDKIAAAGYDGIKIYNQVGAAEYPALTAEAKKKGLVLVGHVAREPGFAATLAAGQSIAHAEEYVYTFFHDDPSRNEVVHPLDTARIPKAVAMTREAGISVIPTLIAFRNIVRQATDVGKYLKDPNLVYMAPSMRAKLEPARNTYATRFDPELVPGLAVSYEFQRQLVKALHDGGVPILAGTDASWLGVPGFCLLDEIEIFQELGFTPYAAIKTATLDPARLLKKEGEFGTISAGKRADLILSRENPLEDVRRLREPEGVMVAGRWIPKEERRRLLAGNPGGVPPDAGRARERRGVGSAGARRVPAGQRSARRGRKRRAGRGRVEARAAGADGDARGHPEERSAVAAGPGRGDQRARIRLPRAQADRRGDRGLPPEHGALSEVGQHVGQPRRDVSLEPERRSSAGSATRKRSKSNRTIRTRRRRARSSGEAPTRRPEAKTRSPPGARQELVERRRRRRKNSIPSSSTKENSASTSATACASTGWRSSSAR